MAEYIERAAVKKVFEDFGKPLVFAPGLAARQIDAIPAADVATVVHGYYVTDWLGDSLCSVCGEKYLNCTQNYCPNRGAKMDGERKGDDG